MKKLIRITTISESLNTLLKGQLNYLSGYYDVIGVASGEELLREIEKREKIRVVNIPIRREIKIMDDFRSLVLIIRLLRKEKPFIVHANTPKGSLLGMLGAWFCKVPCRIYTVTGLRFETTSGHFRKLLVLMERITCFCATHVIPEGAGVMKTIQKEGVTRKPLKVIHNGNVNGIDVSYFNRERITSADRVYLREELNISMEDFVFIFVGRMVRDKGINELICAFDRLSSENSIFKCQSDLLNLNSDVQNHKHNKLTKLLLVGSFEPELDPLSAETLERIKNNPNIITVGFQEDVRPYYAISDCLAFPSYREGFPNVVMQAGAMELPSIVTDINGCNEIIIDGLNGIIIPSRNADALYEAMKCFVDNPIVIRDLAIESRQSIVSRYEQTDVWKALLAEYKKMEDECTI